ncbi:MAG: acyltransferase [Actinomycetota bacterium]|nr:acyltransferase [Actinomycetota bacterium]
MGAVTAGAGAGGAPSVTLVAGPPDERRHLDHGGAEKADAAPARPARHLHDVDVVRFTTVLGVLCVHATSLMLPSTEASGVALAVLHVTREVFLFLSAFVLAYSTRLPLVARSFWRRRFPLVAAPYVVWSAIYVLADGDLGSPVSVMARFCRDLLSGAARFHLYFLILTFQLYVVFPWVRAWLVRRSRHGRILVAALLWQVAFAAAIHYRLDLPAPISTWLQHPGTWLPSYVLYVVGGILAALHFDRVRAEVRRHRRLIGLGTLVVFGWGIISYELDIKIGHVSPLHAGEVFAPAVVVESVAAIAGQFALGLWIAERAGPRALRLLRTSSDVSFGVYLAHPLLYQGFLAALAGLGLHRGLGGLPTGVGLALVLVVVAPSAYAITAVGVWLLRRTPLSMILTGRRARGPKPQTLRSPRLPEVAPGGSTLAPAAVPPVALNAPGSSVSRLQNPVI